MKSKETLVKDGYAAIDGLLEIFEVKNDAALSRTLSVAPPVISKIRSNTLGFGNALLVKVMRKTDKKYSELQPMIGLV